ncbi:hypothetical protein [Cellulomonas carbonis]|uniref:Uncharacterized protein n=1 Tax=Cellulomonas carbonis T26 TaxID=947969 RepID=A0A0A0BKS6_9CELL|nr:hypothetical protein [Cellulomonas carbonis]KGM09133.1 hypothetical protein N868_04390 [Cellulomonas carbonis T26]
MPTPSDETGPAVVDAAVRRRADALRGGRAEARAGRRRIAVARSAVARRLLDRPLRDLGAGATVVLLASTAAFGGLRDAGTTVDALAPGTALVAAPLEVTVDKVLWVDELPGAYPSEDGNRWIAVLTTFRSTHDATLLGPELRPTLSLEGVPGLVGRPDPATGLVGSTERLVLTDGSRLTPVQPGLEHDAVFLFEQDGDVAPPTEVTLVAVGQTFRSSSLQDLDEWTDPAVVARGTLPVREAVDSTEGR